MEVEEFEERTKSIVEVELKKITTMVKKIPDKNAKKQATLLGLSTIDVDIKSNPLAFNVLKNFVACYRPPAWREYLLPSFRYL